MPSAEAPTIGAGDLERGQRVGGTALLARAGLLELLVQLLLAAQQVLHRHAHVVQHHLGGVRGADADLVLLLALRVALAVLLDDERGLAAVAELGVHGGHDHGHVGDAAVGDEDLGAVQDPLVRGLVELGGGAQRLDVGAGAGLGHRVGAELDLVAVAVALGHPAGGLLGGARRRRSRPRPAPSRRWPARCPRSRSASPPRRSRRTGPRSRCPSSSAARCRAGPTRARPGWPPTGSTARGRTCRRSGG